MKQINKITRFALLLAAILTCLPTASMGGQPAVTVQGGGTAEFLDASGNATGLTSQFSVGAVIDSEGAVNGHFVCMIVAIVTISGNVQSATVNTDGTVTLAGVGHGIEHGPDGPVPFTDCPFAVTLSAGGPGAGGFVYSDCVVTGDVEVVTRGHIQINSSGQSVAAAPDLGAAAQAGRGRCPPRCERVRGSCICPR